MTDIRKAAMQAALEILDAIDAHADAISKRALVSATAGLRAALAQPEQQAEPVAWRHNLTHTLHDTKDEVQLADAESWAEPLYLHPAHPLVRVPTGWKIKRKKDILGSVEIRSPKGWTSVVTAMDRNPGNVLLELALALLDEGSPPAQPLK